MEVTLTEIISILIAVFLLGVTVGAVIYDELNDRLSKAYVEWERLLNEREKLLNQIDTERYKVFNDTFKDN